MGEKVVQKVIKGTFQSLREGDFFILLPVCGHTTALIKKVGPNAGEFVYNNNPLTEITPDTKVCKIRTTA